MQQTQQLGLSPSSFSLLLIVIPDCSPLSPRYFAAPSLQYLGTAHPDAPGREAGLVAPFTYGGQSPLRVKCLNTLDNLGQRD